MLEEKNIWFPEKEYVRYNYDLNENSIVIDLGGYKGDFSFKIYEKYNCTIYVYEPLNIFFDILKERFKENEKIKIFNQGVQDKNYYDLIYEQEDGSSLYSINENSKLIKLIDIKDVIENFETIDLLKINTEGSEYKILNRILDCNLQEKIKNIQVQFHKFIPDSINLRNNIRERLSKTHETTYDFPFVWENWKRK